MGLFDPVVNPMVSINCCNCGVLFAVPNSLNEEWLKNRNRMFFCPNGHSQHYLGQTEAQKLRAELDRKQKELEWARQATERANERTAQAEARRRSAKGAATKLRKRIEKGQCPHCTKVFSDVAAHIEKEHGAGSSGEKERGGG